MTPKKRRSKTADLATAYHEAGHAVAAWRLLGVRAVMGVDIDPDEDGKAGVCYHKNPMYRVDPDIDLTPSKRKKLEDGIRICLAGEVAQRKYNPRSIRHTHARQDFHVAVDLASYVNGDVPTTEAYLKWLLLCTKGLIGAFWPAIEALAAELVTRRKMSKKEIQQWLLDFDVSKLYPKGDKTR